MIILTVLNNRLIAFLKAEWVGQKSHNALKLSCSYILTFCALFFLPFSNYVLLYANLCNKDNMHFVTVFAHASVYVH